MTSTGSFVYNPNGAYNSLTTGQTATDSFTYQVSDGTGNFDTATNFVTVTGVNDAPTLANGTLAAVLEDATNPAGATLGTIFSGQFSDADTGSSLGGIAVVSNTANPATQGTWQYSTDGTNWYAIGTVTDGATALAFNTSSLLRFVPAANYSGTPTGLVTRGLDDTYSAGFTSGALRINVDTSSNGGSTSISGATANVNTAITAVNDAPVLTPYAPTYNITEDTAPIAVTVATILGSSVTDVDTGSVTGIAIDGWAGSGGTLTYSINGGSTWQTVTTATPTASILLRSTDQLRFSPNGQNGGTLNLSYRAWDQTSGTAGTSFDTTTNGGTSAFSTAQDAVAINVASVNDAPVLDSSGTMTLNSITEDDTNNSGQTVASIIASAGGNRITDVDTAAVEGIAVTLTNSGNGSWQYSLDNGTSWLAVGVVTDSSALLLRNDDYVRFMPNGQNSTTAFFQFQAWDQSSGTAGTKVSVSTHGGSTAFSTATEIASINVTAINDAPSLTNGGNSMFPSTNENTPSEGAYAGNIVVGVGGSDVDINSFRGMAITSIVGNGTWTYTTDGSNWYALTGASETNAILIRSSTGLRYLPDSDRGETASLGFRAYDQTEFTPTSGASIQYADPGVGGGTSAFSTQTAFARVLVLDVNDAPDVTGPATAIVAESGSLTFDASGSGLIDTSDVDGDDLTVTLTANHASISLASTIGLTLIDADGSNGTLQFSGNQADIDAALDGLTYNSLVGYNGAASLVVLVDDGLSGGAVSIRQQRPGR